MIVSAALKPGWRVVKFGDVVRKVNDKVDPETAGIERYVAGEHMDTDDLRIRRWGEVGDGYLGPAFRMRFTPGQVLYGSRRTYLRKVALADFEGICANTTFVVETATEDLLPEFLPYVMTSESFHEHSIRQSKGSVNPYINFSDLTWYEFTLPPLDEQKQMVRVLQAFDATADAWRDVDELLRTLEAAVGARAQDFPMVPLGDLLLESPRNGLTIEPSSSPTGVRALTLSSVGEAGFISSGYKWIQNEDLRGFEAHQGDLFITRSNTHERVGLPFVFPGADGPVVYSDLMMRLSLRPGTLDPRVLESYLRSASARAFIRSIAAGTSASMKKINATNLKRLPVPVMPALEQERSIELLQKFAAATSHLDRKFSDHRVLRATCLNSMMKEGAL